ncbi:MAG: hypothetical protein JNM78_17875 [Cyclobacteriaceae bacterium]|nr:hypothetical protein [Cyclobacteriaceae bacterium]
MIRNWVLVFIIGLSVLMLSCNERSRGPKMEYDSLFLGFTLGMERQAFFDHCWDYNKKEILIHGSANQTVQYQLNEVVSSPVSMNFYPSFYDDKIFEMPVTFSYEAWAPWNRQYYADSLFVDMIKVFKKWYGEDFKELNHPEMGKVYYKLDGRRRINLYIRDERFVQAVFTDMKIEKELEELAKKEATKN